MAFLTKLEQVAEKLREQIIAGEFKRGDKLKQIDIAEQLGVSVTPVREALKTLEMEGYIVSQPHRGLCVPELDFAQAEEVYSLRILLERELTRAALNNLTPDGLRDLQLAQQEFDRQSRTNDVIAARAANVRFHFRLYEMAKRPQTLQFVRVLWAKYPFNYQEQQSVRFQQITDEHDDFLKRAAEGDFEAAVDTMCVHIEHGWQRVSSLMQSDQPATPA